METLTLTPHEVVRIRRAEPDRLEVEATYLPGKPPPRHLHPGQDERFEVLDGQLSFELDGQRRRLGPGESVEIPRGTAHRVWNEAEAPARAVWLTTPAGETEAWFRALDGLGREGRRRASGMPAPLDAAVLLHRYRDTFRLAGPDALLRPALSLLARLGRRRSPAPPRPAPN